MIYPGYSTWKVGEAVQGEGIQGAKLDIDLCATEPYSEEGVPMEDLPLLREKFKRGSHVEHMEGAGLGLYISDYFMREMKGELVIENGKHGLAVTVSIPFSM